ncbi:unnamed protein product [Cyclocybe aegerita]|uniref:Tumor susceptibility gene 101 protein n=1 Tax=Cyclocybe aegerita TaxID=1973307 RepID=A0A8S0Y152_CYCAE|nr:unnamed protein product [Cyclocybe aegerita]
MRKEGTAELEIGRYRVPAGRSGGYCLFHRSFILPYPAQSAGHPTPPRSNPAPPRTAGGHSPAQHSGQISEADARPMRAGSGRPHPRTQPRRPNGVPCESSPHGVTTSPVTASLPPLTMGSSLTHKWLQQHVQPYPNAPRVYADIDAVLTRFPALRPKSDVYTFDDGRTQLLLCVHGLLPITYRQASYNIPMAFWIAREYPRRPPIAYVVPTSDMLVKPGRYVDVSGRCNIEYLQNWERKAEGCSLSALCEALQDHFSREPPVYSKPKGHQQPSSISQRYADKPPPPVPSTSSTPTPPPPPVQISSPARPALPNKPPSLVSPSPAQYQGAYRPAGATSHAPSSPVLPQTAPPPPLPPHPPAALIGHATPIFSSVGIVGGPFFSPAPHSFRGDSVAISNTSPHPPLRPLTSLPISPPPPPALPPPVPLPQSHVVSSYLHVRPPDPPRPEPHHPPIPDLLDEDNDSSTAAAPTVTFPAPPPRPPNPELLRLQTEVHQKLTSELNSLSQALSLDAEKLRAQQADLLAGEPAIKDEMARLEAVRDVCRNVASRTGQAVRQAEANIAELRRKGDPEVDELVCATTIVDNQLINLIADDNAIEDTLYHLHRALNAGRIDLERFLRSTRVLAEEQFMKRALIEKIQNGMSSMPSSSYAHVS